ncbi:PHP domain-containing protein, partial [Veillonella caviae]
MLVDFHMHSTFSDGVETPQSLLQHAMEHNISIMALTDHDEIDGIDELLSQPSIVKIITGCEFSGHYK